MSLLSGLQVGAGALKVASEALNTTSHNISNADTPGYTRQQISQADRQHLLISGATPQVAAKQVGLGVPPVISAAYIPQRVSLYAQEIGVEYGRITIRNQKSRWGSCSSDGNLNFNCLLMLTPPDVIDYVVVHELCHRLEMNHSPRFWAEVESVMPAYKKHRKWLKMNGGKILRRMTER